MSLPTTPPDDSLVVGWWDYGSRQIDSWRTGKRLKVGVNIGERCEFAYVHLRVGVERAEVLELEDISGDQLLETVAHLGASRLINVGYVYVVHRHGLWAPWYETWYVRPSVTDDVSKDAPIDAETRERALHAAGAHVASRKPLEGLAIQNGGDAGWRIAWMRVAWNLATLACAGMIVHAIVTHRQFLGQRRWKRGECPRCRYALLSVPAKSSRRTCPECGVSAPVV